MKTFPWLRDQETPCAAVNAFYLHIIIGALILAAVAFDQWQARRT